MKEKLCSVIVPVYNVEKYLNKCINSLLLQDYENVEIILIDDGSTDNSGKLIDRLVQGDARVIVVHKVNGGVSEARNTGLAIAKGEYIMFVDGDDYVEKNYVSKFVALLENSDADMAVSYNRIYNDELPNCLNKLIQIKKSITVLEEMYLEKVDVAVWNKIYQKSFLDNHKIRFKSDFWFAEGMTFNVECFLHSAEICVSNFELYHQVFNMNSAVRKFNLNSWYCGQRAMLYQKDLIVRYNSSDDVLHAWAYHYFGYDFVILRGLYIYENPDDYKIEIQKAKKNLRKNLLMPLKANISIKKKIKCVIQSLCPEVLIRRDKTKVGNG